MLVVMKHVNRALAVTSSSMLTGWSEAVSVLYAVNTSDFASTSTNFNEYGRLHCEVSPLFMVWGNIVWSDLIGVHMRETLILAACVSNQRSQKSLPGSE